MKQISARSQCNIIVVGSPVLASHFTHAIWDFRVVGKSAGVGIVKLGGAVIDSPYGNVSLTCTISPELDEEVALPIIQGEVRQVLIVLVQPDENNRLSALLKPLDDLENLPLENTVTIVNILGVKADRPAPDFGDLRLLYPWVDHFLSIPIGQNTTAPYQETGNFIQEVIINACTDRLSKVRALVEDNYRSKRPELNLGNCGLTSLREVPLLAECGHLETLIISNEWGELIDFKWNGRRSENDGPPNILMELSPIFKGLRRLKKLVAGGNWRNKRSENWSRWSISDISNLSVLHNLRELNISNNAVSDLTPLGELGDLQLLQMNNNCVEDLRPLSHLTNLRFLFASNNNIQNVEPIARLKLDALDLHSNRISDLRPLRSLINKIGIHFSSWGVNTITIKNNPLTTPPADIVVQGEKSVLNYFQQLDAEERVKLDAYENRDIKLILVGNSNVGKSTLAHWLLNREVRHDIASTHWLKELEWSAQHNGDSYRVRIFDFGGQEYYHDTHPIFFTSNTAYIVLWDKQSNALQEQKIEQRQSDGSLKEVVINNFPLAYWLDSITVHSRGGKTDPEKDIEAAKLALLGGGPYQRNPRQSAPNLFFTQTTPQPSVLVVQNKVDTKSDRVFINEEYLASHYTNIAEFAPISVHHNIGLSFLNESLFNVFKTLAVVQKYPGAWGIVKEALARGASQPRYTLSEFKTFCNEEVIKYANSRGIARKTLNEVLFTDSDVLQFAQFLRDIGLALYFPGNSQLSDRIYLDKINILGSVYKLLEKLESREGKFSAEDAAKVLGVSANDDRVIDTIGLMQQFKIIFPHPSGKGYIAPLYLPKKPIYIVEMFRPLFHTPVYRYFFKTDINKNVVLEFFSRYGAHVLKDESGEGRNYFWRDGLILKGPSSQDLVMVEFISASKLNAQSSIDVYKIKGNEDETFLKEVVKVLDELSEGWEAYPSVSCNGKDFVELREIRENEKQGNWVFKHSTTGKYFKLAQFKKYLAEPSKVKRIFISYSKQDFAYVQRFIDHLAGMQRDGKVSHWFCSEMEAGAEWNPTIQKQMDEADIICFMISPNFMKTPFIQEHEVPKAFERKDRDPNFKIIPVILDFCRWKTTRYDLTRFQALPYTAKPIVDFKNENKAWYLVEESLRLIIERDSDVFKSDELNQQGIPKDLQAIYREIISETV
jgi:internalin A